MMQPVEGGVNPSAGSDAFGRPQKPTSQYDDDALEKAKRQVEDVKTIMGENVQRIIARGETLEHLDQRATDLSANANEFQRTSRSLQRKMWWKNTKMILIIALVVIIIVVIIIVAAVGPSNGGGDGNQTPSPP